MGSPHPGGAYQTQNRLVTYVWDRFEEGGFVVLGPDNMGWPGTDRLSLEVRNSSAVLFALATSRIVTLHAVQEILTTAEGGKVHAK